MIIPTHNRSHLLKKALQSVFRQDGHDALEEVIVVTDRCGDGTNEMLRDMAERHTSLCIASSDKPGCAAARNVGLRVARGDVIAFIDDDVVCEEGWLTAIAAPLEDPRVGGVEGMIRLPSGKHSPFVPWVENVPGRQFMAANIAYRREPLLAMGGFDERYTMSREDSDMAWRFLDQDQVIVSAPEATVTHDATDHAGLFVTYARRAVDDVRLWRRHRKRFRKARYRIVPRSYWLNIAAALTVAIGAVFRRPQVIGTGLTAMAVFLAYTIAKRSWGRRATPSAALRLFWQFLWIPWLHLWCAAQSFRHLRDSDPWT